MANADCITLDSLANLRRTFAERLVQLRKRKNWTQYDLAPAAGISVDTLRGYEQQKRWPDPEIIEALAKALDCRPADILIAPEDMSEAPITVDHALFVLRAYIDATKKADRG